MSRALAERRGRRAEQIAALWLMLRGWQIMARRRQFPMIEVDIIARRGDVVLVVEVKYRQTMGQAIRALTPWAAEKLARAAAQVAGETGLSARVDLIAIAPWRLPRHLRSVA